MKINICGGYYSFELYEDNGGNRYLFVFDESVHNLSPRDRLVAGFCGTVDETANAICDMLSASPTDPEDWDGQFEDVRLAYDEVNALVGAWNGGAWEII